MQLIQNWSQTWGLMFGPIKTKAIIFTRRKLPNINLTINGSNIETVKSHRFLGVILDRTLTWKPHITYLKKRCEKDLNMLKIIGSHKWGADLRTLRKVYISIILSKINYGLFLYSVSCKYNLKMVETIQSTAQRIILKALRCSKTEHLNILSNILPIRLQADKQLAKYTC